MKKPNAFDLFDLLAEQADQAAERAAERAATVYCAALNELYAALGVTTQAEALQRVADLKLQ